MEDNNFVIDPSKKFTLEESRNGDIIVLSPACSSTDMFTDYRERGDRFKELLKQS